MIKKMLPVTFLLLLVGSLGAFGQQACSKRMSHCAKMQQSKASVSLESPAVLVADQTNQVNATSAEQKDCQPENCDPAQCDPAKCPPAKDCKKACEAKAATATGAKVSTVSNTTSTTTTCQPAACKKMQSSSTDI